MHQSIQRLPVVNDKPTARFAMSRLEFGVSESANDPLSAPPYEFSHEDGSYNILFNMYGIPESGIKVGIDPDSQRVTKCRF